jgi:DUF4097 and DUF4098 domain-containing protein YvlB
MQGTDLGRLPTLKRFTAISEQISKGEQIFIISQHSSLKLRITSQIGNLKSAHCIRNNQFYGDTW